jgi:4-hydroxybenzoyl-CoA reductase subunit beta
MMRLPMFEMRSPLTIAETARILAGEGADAALLAGGTDLLPKMKRRQQSPRLIVSLRQVSGLRDIERGESTLRLGACLTLARIAGEPELQDHFSALGQAASQVATPLIRNAATLCGNLCIDTRCNYYDQTYEWRKAIGFCLKKDGACCWVAPRSAKCLAVSSTDLAPALMALGARVRLISQSQERELPLADLYQNDGIAFLTRRHDEIVAEVLLDSPQNGNGFTRKSTYWKLRRRGAFDFPVLSVAAAVKIEAGVCADAKIVIGAAASRPLAATKASSLLIGSPLSREVIDEAARLASPIAKPLDNTDFDMAWRRKLTFQLVTNALRELRGDDMRSERLSLAC